MNTMNRRIEIINILIIRRHTTANELAQELGVSIRTIQYDIQALSPQYPIYTKPGENGGLFIREDYNPHINSLTPMELENLREMYEQTEGVHSGKSLTGKTRLRGFSHVHTSFTSLLLSVLCGLWYTMVNMGHHGNIETDRM